MNNILSKTNFMHGVQCGKYVWNVFNRKESIPEPDEATLHRFEQGNLVGEYARKVYPEGTLIERGPYSAMIAATDSALTHRRPIFEATLSIEGLLARVDILYPSGTDAWEIIEVKSSTKVKDEHLDDVAFQLYCAERSGLKIDSCKVMYINNEYVRSGKVEPKRLFASEDITQIARSKQSYVESKIKEIEEIIELRSEPDVGIGKQCLEPYECPIKNACWDFLPENNVLELSGFKKELAFDLVYGGVVSLAQVPSSYRLSSRQSIQKDSVIKSETHVNRGEIRNFLRGIRYPVCFLDFETYAGPIPLFDGIRPYQQVPFQFSIDIKRAHGSEMIHYDFLADFPDDPREPLVEAMKVLPREGTLLAYNASFERRVILDLTKQFPAHRKWLTEAAERLVDLMIPFRSFSYYNPEQHGSYSIKNVLPAMTGRSYGDLEINRGDYAMQQYYRMNFEGVAEDEKTHIREALLEYCSQDTSAMEDLLNNLIELAGSG